jgi:hypothetical protein
MQWGLVSMLGVKRQIYSLYNNHFECFNRNVLTSSAIILTRLTVLLRGRQEARFL